MHTIEGKIIPACCPAHGSAESAPAAATRGIAYWQIFRGHIWLLLTFAVVGTLGGLAYCVFQPPVYAAASTVELTLPLSQSFMQA